MSSIQSLLTNFINSTHEREKLKLKQSHKGFLSAIEANLKGQNMLGKNSQ
jgi:hypothetical protein